MRILVTGASGFIGGHVARLLALKHDVFAITRSASVPDGVEAINADLATSFDTSKWPNVDTVVHLAQAPDYTRFPSGAIKVFSVAAMATQRLLDFSVRAGAKRFVFTSTGGLYAQSNKPVTENDPVDIGTGPLAHYFASKRAGELIVQSYASEIDVTSVRVFFCYGPGQASTMLLPRLASSVKNENVIHLDGENGLKINPIFIDDAALGFASIVECGGPDVLNLAGPRIVTLREVGEILGRHLSVRPVFELKPSVDEPVLSADISLFLSMHGQQMIDPEQGLQRLVEQDSLVT
jgi:UDP-glucose 4-epimerase